MSAETELYSALSGNAGLAALVSDRIYPDALPEKCVYPAIVIVRQKTDPIYGVSGTYFGANVLMQIECWSKSRTNADSVAEATIEALAVAGEQHQGRNAGYDPDTDLYASVIEVDFLEV